MGAYSISIGPLPSFAFPSSNLSHARTSSSIFHLPSISLFPVSPASVCRSVHPSIYLQLSIRLNSLCPSSTPVHDLQGRQEPPCCRSSPATQVFCFLNFLSLPRSILTEMLPVFAFVGVFPPSACRCLDSPQTWCIAQHACFATIFQSAAVRKPFL